jgi:hypothetical protein
MTLLTLLALILLQNSTEDSNGFIDENLQRIEKRYFVVVGTTHQAEKSDYAADTFSCDPGASVQ